MRCLPTQLRAGPFEGHAAIRGWLQALLLFLSLSLGGCATRPNPESPRPFVFYRDTFSFHNQLLWEYHFDPVSGKSSHHRRNPPAHYSHRCFVLARSARQFFHYARFDPKSPLADETLYRQRIRQVLRKNPTHAVPERDRIVFPGYANLAEFSRDWAPLLQEECGGAWQSYVQRGHWRMVFPFTRSHQAATARQLIESLDRHRPPVVHIHAFPSLAINHALLLFDYSSTPSGLAFAAYDPNTCEHPVTLYYNAASRQFSFQANLYFRGGPVDIYEVYRSWLY